MTPEDRPHGRVAGGAPGDVPGALAAGRRPGRLMAGAVARRVVAELGREAVPIVPEGQRWALDLGLLVFGVIEEMDGDD
jgi:hypothetical protein